MTTQVEEYLNYIKNVRSYSDNTISGYQNELAKFQNYLEEHHIDFKKITKEEIWEYLKYLDALHYSNTSISRHISAIRSFYNFLKQKELIDNNIFKTIRNPKIKRKLPNVLNYEEIRELFQFKECKTPKDYITKALFELFYATGLRISELVSIKIKDINFGEQSIRVLGKGKKERIVFFGDYAKDAMNDYLGIRESLMKKPTDYFFLNLHGNPMNRRTAEEIIYKRVDEVALNHHISAHTLRHTFATHMLENGADIRTVQELLGHEKLSTTQIYTHLTSEYLRGEYLKKMPRK